MQVKCKTIFTLLLPVSLSVLMTAMLAGCAATAPVQSLPVPASSPASTPASASTTAPVTTPRHTEVGGGNYKVMTIPCGDASYSWRMFIATPRWPSNADPAIEKARVLLGFTVTEQGKAEAITVAEVSHPEFAEPAQAALRQSRFEFPPEAAPCLVGKPMVLPMVFQLD
ncbi:TonB family protein [Permianibacter sp. IMCC34836]|uniref:TonB family protein n=1 Tax=Permianibacter fluminis TaxID=2738515 RepID=UPI00155357CE|nr:TonB family protein [Permianibacter fluminis]NQD36380.1 TonB family protein [Permianibacter fluminis]